MYKSQYTYFYLFINLFIYFSSGVAAQHGPKPHHFLGFEITHIDTTVGITPLNEGSARRRDPFLTTHNNHKRHTSMVAAEFELALPVSKRPQTVASDRSATGTGIKAVL
jgi:hypothetical protein